MMKIAFFSAKEYDKKYFEPLSEKLNISITYFKEQLNFDTASLAKGFDATCSFVNDDVNGKVIESLKQMGVKAILLRCAGYDSVDLEKAKELDMPVLRVPSYSPEAVAEHAAALLLAVNRKVHLANNRTKKFNFDINGLMGIALNGKTAGVIGTGKIGKAMINILKGFGMDIIAYDIYQDINSNIKYVSLDELFSKADVITLHVPLTSETKHLINSENISKMKDDAILINTARGALIKTEDLIEALEEGKFAGVGLDVYENERGYFYEDKSYLKEEERDKLLEKLLSFDRVIVTGHQAYFADVAMEAIAETTLTNLKNYMEKGQLTNEVNQFLEGIKA